MLPQVLKGWSLNDTRYDNVTTLLKKNCKRNITDDGSYFPLGGGDGILTNLPQKSMRAAMETIFQLELPPYSMMSRAVATRG